MEKFCISDEFLVEILCCENIEFVQEQELAFQERSESAIGFF